jgi:hypothetical protein
MIGAFDRRAVVASKGERKGSMGANVAEGERFACGIASEHEGNLEARRGDQPPAADLIAPQDRIPKSPEEFVAHL